MTTHEQTAVHLADRASRRLEQLDAEAECLRMDAEDLAALLEILARHPSLWDEFQTLLPCPDQADELGGRLVRLARESEELVETIEHAEALWDVGAGPAQLEQLAHDLRHLGRALWHGRRCPPFGALAERIGRAAGRDVVDGLDLAALAWALAVDVGLLAAAALALRQLRDVA
jgi:hypothetical protein